MVVQAGKIPSVIFAGNQFNQPFSHSPMWLEELIERGYIFKEGGVWMYIAENGYTHMLFKRGDKVITKDQHFEVICDD